MRGSDALFPNYFGEDMLNILTVFLETMFEEYTYRSPNFQDYWVLMMNLTFIFRSLKVKVGVVHSAMIGLQGNR